MSLTFVGWLFVVCSIAILLLFLLRSRGARNEQTGLATLKAGLQDIADRLKLGELKEAEADAARLALLSKQPSSNWGFSKRLQGTPLTVAASVALLLVLGIGTAIPYVGTPSKTTRTGETNSVAGADGEMFTQLADYVRSIEGGQTPSKTETSELLPDVNTMIERLEARLATTPRDIEGWRTLGWSYFHTERYEQAAKAFGRALELDPASAELKLSFEEAKAKASGSDSAKMAAPMKTEANKSGGGVEVDKATELAAMPQGERDAAIRSMVDGLAQRLESSPRDADGWIHLMRSRIVLGEGEVAATAFRRALEVFVDDKAASAKIAAAAVELGLKAE